MKKSKQDAPALFLDCGAPSLYNKLSRKLKIKKGGMGSHFKDRKYDDFSYVQNDEYKKYRKSYIDFLCKNKEGITTYSNMDVINNAELTWENQKIMEDAGLNPIPVFHLGCDEKWLKFYINNYPYIALGGLIPNPTTTLRPILSRLFKEYILDDSGKPKVKVHGFACTAIPLMLEFPWYSVDSSSWQVRAGGYGLLDLPTNPKLETIKDHYIRSVPISKGIKGFGSKQGGLFADEVSSISQFEMTFLKQKMYRKAITELLSSYGFDLEKMQTDAYERSSWNAIYATLTVQKFSKTKLFLATTNKTAVEHLRFAINRAKLNINIHLLTSFFFYPKTNPKKALDTYINLIS